MPFHTKTAILLVLFIALSAICRSQNTEEQFSKVVLNNPVAHSSWFDRHFPITEVLQYAPTNDTFTVFLRNGYASHKILNSSEWTFKRGKVTPVRVQIIFTKQPFDKKDWVTNYYELLANRISEMLQIDSSLNTKDIEWEIILQTQALSTSEAIKLPHGIAIVYQRISSPKAEMKVPRPIKVETPNDIERCLKVSINSNDSLTNQLTDEELKAILYPKSVMEKSTEWHKPQKVTKTKEPSCPTFKTRMEKPKRRLFSRIFK